MKTIPRTAILLLIVGLLGHVLAADAEDIGSLAYRHHIFGFFFILAVTGSIVALIGRRFWKDRPHITWFVISALQAVFGILIYAAELYKIHG